MAKRNGTSVDGKRLPLDLADVARQFASWRAQRRRGSRIPASLWRLAGKMAGQYGVSQTSAVLRVDYYRLKQQAGLALRQPSDRGSTPATPATFLELPALLGSPSGCVIEIEETSGRKLRIQVPASQAAEVVAAMGLGLARAV